MAIDKADYARLSKILREVSAPFADSNPTDVVAVPWIFADRKEGTYPADTDRSGKWLVFVDEDKLDDTWKQLKLATERGLLGGRSKCATALRSPNAAKVSTKVICVYTYDSTDEADVRRVREELRRLGFVKKISYKTDEATLAGRHQVAGKTKIAKYYE